MEPRDPTFEKPIVFEKDPHELYTPVKELHETTHVFDGGILSHSTESLDGLGNKQEPKHYFDVFTGSVIDRKFLEFFMRSDANPENVLDLGPLLRDPTPPLRHPGYRSLKDGNVITWEKYLTPNTSNWTEDNYKRYGKWLYQAVTNPESNHEYRLTEDIIVKARRLGLGPSLTLITKAFGATGAFYKVINARESYRNNAFGDWSVDKFIKYLQKVGRDNEGKPTVEQLTELSRKKPWLCPSPYIIANRVGGGRGIGPALELAGYPDVVNWDKSDYLSWGVHFMKANDGLEISTPILRYLSPKGLSPSQKTVHNNFGVSNFRTEVKELYLEDRAQQEEQRQQKLTDIQKLLERGDLPTDLFSDAKSEEDLLLFYAKYKVVQHLCPEWHTSTLIIISTRGFPGRDFIASVRKNNNAISAGDIESAALYLDVFDDIWPIEDSLGAYKLNEGFQLYYQDFREKEKKRNSKRIRKNIKRVA